MSTTHRGLLGQRRFGPFFWVQALGAFNDNLLKNCLILLITYHASRFPGVSLGLATNLAAGLFILPYLLFSATAGQLADKLPKHLVVRVIKLVEVAIMALAAVGFLTDNFDLLMGCIFLMGTHSAFFGPVKFSILPQVLREDELVGGNGLLEMGTFLSILLGTLAAGLLAGSGYRPLAVCMALLGVSLVGALAAFRIPPLAPEAPNLQLDWNPLRQTLKTVAYARRDRTVFLSCLGISWFWFFGALLLAQIAPYAKSVLEGNEAVTTLILGVFSVGVATGSMLCERMSHRQVEMGLVPFGSIGLSAMALDLGLLHPVLHGPATLARMLDTLAGVHLLADFALIGLFGGFYIVPLYALVQSRTAKEAQSQVMGANNILNALFMVASAALGAGLSLAGFSIPDMILACAALNALVALYIYGLIPEFLWRFVAWLAVRSVYRVRVTGLDHIPATGAAVLVCNHLSFADAPILAGNIRRPVRFVMHKTIAQWPLVNFVFRAMKAIPIAGMKEDPQMLEQAYLDIAAALREGELVCIFPEGGLTQDGEMQPFRKGVERILATTPVPVIPMRLDGLWGSLFSRKRITPGEGLGRLFGSRHLTLTVGQEMPGTTTAEELQVAVQGLAVPG